LRNPEDYRWLIRARWQADGPGAERWAAAYEGLWRACSSRNAPRDEASFERYANTMIAGSVRHWRERSWRDDGWSETRRNGSREWQRRTLPSHMSSFEHDERWEGDAPRWARNGVGAFDTVGAGLAAYALTQESDFLDPETGAILAIMLEHEVEVMRQVTRLIHDAAQALSDDLRGPYEARHWLNGYGGPAREQRPLTRPFEQIGRLLGISEAEARRRYLAARNHVQRSEQGHEARRLLDESREEAGL
jgi:hypothetical protein